MRRPRADVGAGPGWICGTESVINEPLMVRAPRGPAFRAAALPIMVPLVLGSLAAARAAAADGAEVVEEGEPVSVDAESISYEEAGERALARGHVVIRYGRTELRADEVQFERSTRRASAAGHVRLSDPLGLIFADQVDVDLDDETGVLLGAEIQAREGGYTLLGRRIEKREGHSYHIEDGVFTTCRCQDGPPSWSIAARRLDVELEGYAVLEDGEFRIRDVPVLVLPRFRMPVGKRRQSGLLFPRVGFSNRRGLQLLLPYYWAIDKSQDATFSVDVESQARIGLLGEYRYAATRHWEGIWRAAYFNEKIRGAATESSTSRRAQPDIPENRWAVSAENTYRKDRIEVHADLLYAGDDLFFREMNTYAPAAEQEARLRTLPFTASRLGAVYRSDRALLHGQGVWYQDLLGSDSRVLQRVPEFGAAFQYPLPGGVMAELAGAVVDFQRDTGIDGLRFDLRPALRLRLPVSPAFRASAYAAFRETAYLLTESEMTGGFRGDRPVDADGDGRIDTVRVDSGTRETFELGARFGTALDRVFGFGRFGISRLKHTIEPEVSLLYVPAVDQDDIPVFDGFDRISPRTLVTWRVASRLLARRSPEAARGDADESVMELLRFSIAQSYDVERDIPAQGEGGSADHFSDVDLALRVRPTRRTSVRFVSSLDVSRGVLSASTVEVALAEWPWRSRTGRAAALLERTQLRAAYRFVNSAAPEAGADAVAVPSGSFDDVQQFDGGVVLRLTDHLGLQYASVYDLPNNRFLENHFGAQWLSRCDCWRVDAGITDKANPNEVEFRLQVTLIGLGGAGLGF